jgi:F0F1-type ATP synthase membrane subunit b/b'
MLGGMLDKRADGIKSELDEARALREEAQTLLASYERKQREVAEQSERIVAQARTDAEAAAEAAKAELAKSIERRLAAAEDQIASAEAKAVRAVSDRAVEVAVAAAGEIIASRMAAADADSLIDASIERGLGAVELTPADQTNQRPGPQRPGRFRLCGTRAGASAAEIGQRVEIDLFEMRGHVVDRAAIGLDQDAAADQAGQLVIRIEKAFAVDALDPAHGGHDRGIAEHPAMAPTIGLSATIMIVKLRRGRCTRPPPRCRRP